MSWYKVPGGSVRRKARWQSAKTTSPQGLAPTNEQEKKMSKLMLQMDDGEIRAIMAGSKKQTRSVLPTVLEGVSDESAAILARTLMQDGPIIVVGSKKDGSEKISVRLTDVRIERLQAITEADAIAEGATPKPGTGQALHVLGDTPDRDRVDANVWTIYANPLISAHSAIDAFRVDWDTKIMTENISHNVTPPVPALWADNPMVLVFCFDFPGTVDTK